MYILSVSLSVVMSYLDMACCSKTLFIHQSQIMYDIIVYFEVLNKGEDDGEHVQIKKKFALRLPTGQSVK